MAPLSLYTRLPGPVLQVANVSGESLATFDAMAEFTVSEARGLGSRIRELQICNFCIHPAMGMSLLIFT